MAGHVNMMDDVLITQLPPVILRSALRALVSQGKTSQAVFVDHVQRRLRASPPAFMHYTELFDTSFPSHPQFLAAVRCLFTSKMAVESLPYFSHFLTCILQADLLWASDSELEATLTRACADVVQAVQALKECHPPRTEELRNRLFDLQRALMTCETYSAGKDLSYPFARARLQVDDAVSWFFPDSTTIRGVPASSQPLEWSHLLPDTANIIAIEHTSLGSLEVPRLFNGLWQLSYKQNAALAQLVKAGLLATDMADHYGDAELVYGSFRTRLPPTVANTVIAATKWCIFRPPEVEISRHFVLEAVRERSRRVGGRIELLQFHWYNYSNKDYLLILAELVRISKMYPELVSNIGLCNFDAGHTEEACLYMISEIGEVGLVSNQVQYSLVDSRPCIKLAAVCTKYGLKILTYGSLCGGFISQKWLGAEAPDIYCESLQLTPSQRKYFDMITTWASWNDFQKLLRTLKTIADKHQVELANVATRWVLDRPAVGAVIVGTRLGVSNNAESNVKVFSLKLDQDDMSRLDEFALGRVDRVFESIGDCGHEYQC
ncbi:aldo-keto reductase [Gymnopus androsaceus JB14]|uniref:Aldo-keto reductase n=1 Tax=Gymnopus androsaceus JB14 TaxID=1447944 RepID=A0A6A4HP31_9AGAR|nr:aldo-keto reductase [Gymnopus androsaceus JB14]